MHTSTFDANLKGSTPQTKEKPQRKQSKTSKKRDSKATKSESQIKGLEGEATPPQVVRIITLQQQISETRAKMVEQKLKFVEIITFVVKYLDDKGVSSEEVSDYLARLYPSIHIMDDEFELKRRKEAKQAQQQREEAARKEAELAAENPPKEEGQIHLEVDQTPSKKIRIRKTKNVEEGLQKDAVAMNGTSMLQKTAYETFVGERKSSSKKSSIEKNEKTSGRKSKKRVDLEEIDVSNINRLQDLAENSGGSVSTIEEPRPIVSPYFQPKVTESVKEVAIPDHLSFRLAQNIIANDLKLQGVESNKHEELVSNGKLSENLISGDISLKQYENMKK